MAHRRSPDERMELAVTELAGVRVTGRQFVALTMAFVATVVTAIVIEIGWGQSSDAKGPAILGTRQELGVPGLGSLQELSDRLAAVGTQIERRVSVDSKLTERLAAPVQRFLGERSGGGNEQVYFGRDGWLFFVPDVDHVTGQPFLAPAHLQAHLGDGAAMPDPALGVLLFAAELQRLGISLVVVPVPSKATFHGEQLSVRAANQLPRNPSFVRFIAELRDPRLLLSRYDEWLPSTYGAAAWFAPLRDAVADIAGHLAEGGIEPIEVVDSGAALNALGDTPAFLRTDTHWTPAGADAVAVATARSIRKLLPAQRRSPTLRRRDVPVSQLGDIAIMAQLRSDRWQEEAMTQQVVAGDRLVGPSKDARVLLLGDSFSNVFSWNRMGWGEGAGFGELLRFHLGENVSWLARNADGAHASREALRQTLARGEPLLEHTQVIVWQFAARELSIGNWRQTPLASEDVRGSAAAPGPGSGPFITVSPGQEMEVTGIVVDISRPPLPDSVPYPDHVSYLHLSDVDSSTDQLSGDMLIAVLTMEAASWTDAARLRLGDSVSFLVRNYAAVDDEVRVSQLSATDLESDVMFEIPNWGELIVLDARSGGDGPTAAHWILASVLLVCVAAGTTLVSRKLGQPTPRDG